MERPWENVNEAADAIDARIDRRPEIGLILGSGLGVLAEEIEDAAVIPYEDIPHFPVSTVAGHAGRLVVGTLQGQSVVAMQGRFHYYEGYDMKEVTFPVHVMKRLGVTTLLVTNAAGGMNRSFAPGDIMLITDHLNFTGQNPLLGPNDERLGQRFPDMSSAYSQTLRQTAERCAQKRDIAVQKGVYAGITGPYFLTSAELKMLARLGGDAIGMSTVPEVIVANNAGLDVLGMTCITDMALGEETEPLTHDQVIEVANRTRPRFITLVKAIVAEVNKNAHD